MNVFTFFFMVLLVLLAIQAPQIRKPTQFESEVDQGGWSEVLPPDAADQADGNGCGKPIQGKGHPRVLPSLHGTGRNF